MSAVRYRVEGSLRYAARDTARGCEHAVWRNDRVAWDKHPVGGLMQPFAGPDDAWDKLVADAVHYDDLLKARR